jgi:formate hydrogenlyase transcriptional activator
VRVRPSANDAEVAALRAIVEGTARNTGEAFFQSLVRYLASAVGVNYAFVAEFAGVATRVRTLAYWGKAGLRPNIEYDLEGTPCEDVIRGGLCHHPLGVREKFPRDRALIDMGIESYLGVPLVDGDGAILGHLAVFDERSMPLEPRRLFIFQIFATRAAVELERLRVERRLVESERRYRDLYEEAPNAYLSIGKDQRIINVNRRATQLLGWPADRLTGSDALGHFAETPQGRVRAELALRRGFAGEEVSGLELELRRRDGRPLWISLWMRPMRDAGGEVRAVHSIWVDVTDRVLAVAERAHLQEQNLYLREEIKSVHNFDEIVGRSPALTTVLDMVRRVAPTDATVLLSGETGTGKELIARAIHSLSHRRDKPFIKINCAALPAGLVENELFGHEKGAFTGAIARHTGRFELADGGTIFLDEIGELPPEAQAKLLRVLQEQEFERVGGTRSVRVDVRIVAATNRDLLAEVAAGRFREDLYYRLNVIAVTAPPLRARREDIPLLVDHFLGLYCSKNGRQRLRPNRTALDRMLDYGWPGNVRELENVIERAVVLSRSDALTENDLPDAIAKAAAAPPAALTFSVGTTLADIELRVIRETLRHTKGDKSLAAQLLGISTRTIYRKLDGISDEGTELPVVA